MHDDDADDHAAPPTLADAARQLRYTMSPQLYIDEDSTVNELLWQQVLETRAQRYWTAALALVTTGLLLVLVAILVLN